MFRTPAQLACLRAPGAHLRQGCLRACPGAPGWVPGGGEGTGAGGKTEDKAAHASEAARGGGNGIEATVGVPLDPGQALPGSVALEAGESEASTSEPAGQGPRAPPEGLVGGPDPASPPLAGPPGPQSPASSAVSTSGAGEAGSGAPAAPKHRSKKSSVCEIVAESEVAPPCTSGAPGARRRRAQRVHGGRDPPDCLHVWAGHDHSPGGALGVP